ncbi:prolipoprotein diacylglyceryl transferase [Ideonella sp. DXS22W]|uniref:Phosphatidylglycerol--prolipoprotein diacylglyceryl transferase n=1 Tax=Pseudaquabacterium inlustre TaxID=2984192 RepID=A0ABU9CB29_9BURK
MLVHPQFDPIALALGPVQIHWYGLTYLVAFALFMLLAGWRVRQPWYAQAGWTRRDVEDLLFWGVLGVVLGGRIGYALFYKPGHYLANPLEIAAVWKGGMSFHGGMLGVILAMVGFARSRGRSWLEVTDLIAPAVPTGLASGRIGNFINGELWGRQADASLPWAMVFPQSGVDIPRHPSQLYQFALEGVLLFVLLWLYARKPRAMGQVSGAFLFGYGVFRFVAEYFREPDAHLGLLALGMSMGQWLCVPMIAGGALLWAWATRRDAPPAVAPAAR